MQIDAEPLIREVLGDEKLTTREISARLESRLGYRCPDDLAKTLTKLKSAGKVKGQVSIDAGGWIWWISN